MNVRLTSIHRVRSIGSLLSPGFRGVQCGDTALRAGGEKKTGGRGQKISPCPGRGCGLFIELLPDGRQFGFQPFGPLFQVILRFLGGCRPKRPATVSPAAKTSLAPPAAAAPAVTKPAPGSVSPAKTWVIAGISDISSISGTHSSAPSGHGSLILGSSSVKTWHDISSLILLVMIGQGDRTGLPFGDDAVPGRTGLHRSGNTRPTP